MSEASATYPLKASELRIGSYVMIKGHPCKVVKMSTSKTGKHGHAKINLVGIDIFDGSKHELLSPSTHNVDVPRVTRNDYTLMNIDDDGYLSLMGADPNDIKEDVSLPPNEELADQIRQGFDDGKELILSVLSAVGKEQVVACKKFNN